MRLGLLSCLLALVITGSRAGLAEQPTGPATLENLVQPEETQDASAVTDDVSTAGRPAGTLVRPKDGVQHPDVDKAWVVYEAAVAKAAEGILAAVTKQFDAAAAKGNLDTAEKWQVVGEAFEKKGTLPAEKEIEKEVRVATDTFAKARDGLKKAYEEVVKTLTKQALKDKDMLQEAQRAKAEWKSVAAGAAAPPKPNEWFSIFDGFSEDVWQHGWGNEATFDKETVRLDGADSGLCYQKQVTGDHTFECQVQFRSAAADGRAKIGVCCSEAGAYYLHLYANGGGDVGKWNHDAKKWLEMRRFQGPPLSRGEWHTLELQRDGGRLRGRVDGQQVFDVAIPADALRDGDVQVGVWKAEAVFKGMRLKLLR